MNGGLAITPNTEHVFCGGSSRFGDGIQGYRRSIHPHTFPHVVYVRTSLPITVKQIAEPNQTLTSTSFQLLYAFIVFIFLILVGATIIKLLKKREEKKKPSAMKTKPEVAKIKQGDDSKPPKARPMTSKYKGSIESTNGPGEFVDRMTAPPLLIETRLREKPKPSKMKAGAPVFGGPRETTTGSREPIGISDDSRWTSKTKSEEESKPTNAKAVVHMSTTGSRESTRRRSVLPWLGRKKSREEMKVKPLATKSGSLESL
ncbi:hypothetical protein Y032_0126g1339 [Ancylostoma ceylanicum]|nr:hypothetical protein Y032_0126g1339 [Ancylostoma ceylanicum]